MTDVNSYNSDKHEYIDEDKKLFTHKIDIDIDTSNFYNLDFSDKKKLKYKNDYYKSFPLKGTCYNMGVEDWTDWFTIPYYYINNNYQQGSKPNELKGSFTVTQCYKKCDNNFVINKDNISLCEDIKTFNKGKYKDFIPYDPFAIICIICSKIDLDTIDSSFLKNFDEHIFNNRLKIKDKNNIELDNYIETSINNYDEMLWKKKEEHIKNQINEAYNILNTYINNIIFENGKKNVDTIILNNIIKFYELFDNNDQYYKNIYLKKIGEIDENIKEYNIPKVVVPHYRYAYYLMLNYKKINENVSLGKNIEYIKNLLTNCINLCFSNKYIFCQRLIDSSIISRDVYKICDICTNGVVLPIEPVELKNYEDENIITEYNINDIKIEKENINIFGEYKNVNEHFQSLIILVPSLLILFVIPFLFYYLMLYYDKLKDIITFVNFIIITSSILFGIYIPFWLAILIIFIAGKLIIYPFYVIILKIPIFISIIAIGLIISFFDTTGIFNKIGKIMYGYSATFLLQLLKLFINFLNEILKPRYIILVFYVIYSIIYYIKDEILIYSDPNLDISDFMLVLQIYKEKYIYNYLKNNINEYNEFLNSL